MFFFFEFSFFYYFFLPDLSGAALPPLDSAKVVKLHNDKRAEVDPPAAPPMKKMQWNDGLARLAQAWAENCMYKHGNVPEKADTIAPDGIKFGTSGFGRSFIGQNLYAGFPAELYIAIVYGTFIFRN